MDGIERREAILKILGSSLEPVTGSELAGRFSVSRQVIVQDIALLRASGIDVVATPQGYMLAGALTGGKYVRTFACLHDRDGVEKELNIFVDNGGKVLDVSVEHPIYGELKGMLMINSRRGVQEFVNNLVQTNAQPLSVLTGGVHLHRVEAESPEVLENIADDLAKAEILLGDKKKNNYGK